MCHGERISRAEAHSRRYSRFRDVRLSCSSLCQIWFGKECFQCCELPDENLPFGDKPSFRHALFPDGNDSPFRKTGQKYSLLFDATPKNPLIFVLRYKKIVSGHTHFIVAQTFQKHNHKWGEYAKRKETWESILTQLFFSHEKAAKLTLSSPDEEIRRFWIRHGQACIRISRYFAEELGQSCVMNIWIPDGYKDIPADRLGPRARFKDSLDQILSIPYDRSKGLCVPRVQGIWHRPGILYVRFERILLELCGEKRYYQLDGQWILPSDRGGFGQASDDYAGGFPRAGKRF